MSLIPYSMGEPSLTLSPYSSPGGESPEPSYVRHPTYWFDDGSLPVLCGNTSFNVHGSLLGRQSGYFEKELRLLRERVTLTNGIDSKKDIKTKNAVRIDTRGEASNEMTVTVKDFVVLLEHLYHDSPLQIETRFTRIASILRITGPHQLDIPKLHELALERLNMLLPSKVEEVENMKHREALIRKFMHYDAVTSPDPTSETQPDQPTEEPQLSDQTTPSPSSTPPTAATATSSSPSNGPDSTLTSILMSRFISHFSPIIFTPPPTSHMLCTDALASAWLECVIQPALASDGVYRPLETLEDMKEVAWEEKGICSGCAEAKRQEWTEEQRVVWGLLDGWLEGEKVGVSGAV